MTQKIRTIKRTPDMPKGALYQATDLNGETWYYLSDPTCPAGRIWWCGASIGPSIPGEGIVGGWRKSLRRIVDRDQPKKPKRKMIRVYYYAYSLDFMVFSRSRMKAEAAWRTSARADLKPGPIESALIPEPRRKGMK